jgi:hypothetical protein
MERVSAMPLRVFIDGTPLADLEGRALWQRFSAWMEEHGEVPIFRAHAKAVFSATTAAQLG